MDKRLETEEQEIKRLKKEIKEKAEDNNNYRVGDYVDFNSHENGKGRGRVLDIIETDEGQKLIIEPYRKQSKRAGEILIDIASSDVEKVLRSGSIQKITYR